MAVPRLNHTALVLGEVDCKHGEPFVVNYPLDTASAVSVRELDPVVLTSGVITRGDNTSTALLGFAQTPSIRSTSLQIGQLPYELDSNGAKRLGVYAADQTNFFTARIKSTVATALSQVGTTCDIAPAILSPTPVLAITGGGGATTQSYQITAKNFLGESKPLAATTIASAAATGALSSANYVSLTIPLVNGAIAFCVYRSGIQIAEVSANPAGTTVINDTGLVGTGAAIGTVNDTGWVIDPTAHNTNVVTITQIDSRDPIGTLGGRVEFKVPAAASQF